MTDVCHAAARELRSWMRAELKKRPFEGYTLGSSTACSRSLFSLPYDKEYADVQRKTAHDTRNAEVGDHVS